MANSCWNLNKQPIFVEFKNVSFRSWSMAIGRIATIRLVYSKRCIVHCMSRRSIDFTLFERTLYCREGESRVKSWSENYLNAMDSNDTVSFVFAPLFALLCSQLSPNRKKCIHKLLECIVGQCGSAENSEFLFYDELRKSFSIYVFIFMFECWRTCAYASGCKFNADIFDVFVMQFSLDECAEK